MDPAGLVAIVIAAITAYFTYRTKRDQLQYDATLVNLKAENAAQEERIADLEAQHIDDSKRLQECVDDRQRLHQRLSALESVPKP